jgi:hypothetical protein
MINARRGRELPEKLKHSLFVFAKSGSTRQIRELLTTHNVDWDMDAQSICNLKARVRAAAKTNTFPVQTDLQSLSAELPLSELFDSFQAIHVRNHASGGRLNTTLMLLEQMKQDLPGFEYRMRSEQNSAPGVERTMVSLIWMTARQRHVLGQRGALIMCDATPQTNAEGWFCMPILVVDQHNKGRIVAYFVSEGAENKDAIIWALRQLHEMCPDWQAVRQVCMADYGLTETPYTEAFTTKRLKFVTCCWHFVNQDVPRNVKQDVRNLCDLLWKIIDAPNQNVFKALVSDLYNRWPAAKEYFETWVGRKDQWAKHLRDKFATFGFKTSGMAESMIHALKRWLMHLDDDHSHTSLTLADLVQSAYYKELQTERDEHKAAMKEWMYLQDLEKPSTTEHKYWDYALTRLFRQTHSQHSSELFQQQVKRSTEYRSD